MNDKLEFEMQAKLNVVREKIIAACRIDILSQIAQFETDVLCCVIGYACHGASLIKSSPTEGAVIEEKPAFICQIP